MSAEPKLAGQIADLVGRVLYVEAPATDTDLIESDLIDSLALVSLITEIETEFGVQLPLDDFELDSFRNAERIADYVAPHLHGADSS